MARKASSKKTSKGTRKSALTNKRRKGILSVVVPWMRRFGAGLAVVIFTIWLGAWIVMSGSLDAAKNWADRKIVLAGASAGFIVEDILVEGRQNASADIILAIINMQKGDPILGFDPQGAKEQLERISWVRSAHVERRLPDTIYIRLQERTPIALYNDDGKVRLLDDEGKTIVSGDMERFAGLITMAGKGAPESFPDLARVLAGQPELLSRIQKAYRISDRRWDLELKNGISVKLPKDDVGLALARLADAQESDGLLEREITALDLRENDRISVRVKSGEVQNYQAAYKVKTGSNI